MRVGLSSQQGFCPKGAPFRIWGALGEHFCWSQDHSPSQCDSTQGDEEEMWAGPEGEPTQQTFTKLLLCDLSVCPQSHVLEGHIVMLFGGEASRRLTSPGGSALVE